MLGSNTPSVFGLVSIRHATSPSAFARRSSRSIPPCGVGRELDDLEAGHRHGRGIGPVGGVGRQHLATVGLAAAARDRRASAAAPRARRASRPRAAARRAAARRSPRARPAAATSAPARPARGRGPAADAAARVRAARRRARAGAGCASSCTSRAGRSLSPGRSCAWRCPRSGARSPALRPPAAAGPAPRR